MAARVSGKVIVLGIVAISAVFGAGLWYSQVYAYYDAVALEPGDVTLVSRATQQPEPIAATDTRAIDATSSPIRFRACFDTAARPTDLALTYETLPDIEPLNGPAWFDCYDAGTIDAELRAGTATAFLGAKNIRYGVDRIVVVNDAGRGWIWHRLNDCGEVDNFGTPVGDACPPRGAD
jgi:hypothetical protein